jgi:nicotinamidase-related amidase
MGQRRFRMIASNPLSQPSKDTELALEELQKIYDMRSHIPGRLRDMSWSGWFRINSRMINHLQQRRVFLGGDAAHIHSPAGAQGMNTGIQDMINLCWKLAMVIHGKASPKLLDTYGEDRIPAIRNVLTKTEGLTAAIGSENPVFRTIFNHVAPLVVGTEFVQEKSAARMSQVALNYRESSLSETHGHHRSLRAGDRVPDMTLRVMNKAGSAEQAPREVCLFSLLDPSRFTLFYVNVDDPAELHAEIQAKLAAWRSFIDGYQIAPVESNAVENKHFTSVFGSSPGLVLMRPDSYVGFMGEADSVPHLAAYLQKWFAPEGKRPPRPTREPNMQNPSRLDPTDVQLLFADLQTQIVARSKTTDPKALRMAARVLAQLAKVFSLPVTISTVPEGEHAPELIPELAKEAVGAPQFLRTGASPFLDERTKMALNSHGRKTLVICGVATEVVVLHAATAAIEAGYRALVPVDACGGMSERTESAALRQIEAFGGEVTSTVTMATALAPDFETVLGQQMFAVVQQLRLA